MKKFILFFTFLTHLSCSKPNNTNPTTTNTAAGTYKLTEYNVMVAVDLNNDGVFNRNLVKETSCYNDDLFIFYNTGQCQSMTKKITGYTFPLTVVNCNDGQSTINTNWSENETNVFIERTGGRLIWLKEGNNLRYNYPTNNTGQGSTSFLWTKQ